MTTAVTRNRRIAEWMGAERHVELKTHEMEGRPNPEEFAKLYLGGKPAGYWVRSINGLPSLEELLQDNTPAFDSDSVASHLLREHLRERGYGYSVEFFANGSGFHACIRDRFDNVLGGMWSGSEESALVGAVEQLIEAEASVKREGV